jgi:AcrR family transcriptional regulator
VATKSAVAGRRSIGAQRNPESERAILAAARDLIAEEGLAGFSIEAVARRARAGKPTIYRWWPNRALLLLDVYGGLKEELPATETGTLAGDLAAFLIGLMSFWRAGAGEVFRSVVAEVQADETAREALAGFHRDRHRQTAMSLLGKSRPGEPALSKDQARWLAAAAFGYAFTRLMLDRLDVPEDEVRAYAALLAASARTG